VPRKKKCDGMEMRMDGKARKAAWRTGVALAIFTFCERRRDACAGRLIACTADGETRPRRGRRAPALGGGVLVSWRLLGDDPRGPPSTSTRDGKKLNAKPLKGATNFSRSQGQGRRPTASAPWSAARNWRAASPSLPWPTAI
jgi:hypothetical protein